MATEKFANNASSTLNGGIDNDDTSLTVTSATTFPSDPQFRIKVENEIMLVTGVAGAVFTVVRAQEGTTAASHSNGVAVDHIVTAGSLTQALTDSLYLAGWQTAYEVDFTALTSSGSTVISNGANVIDGKTWYVENSANADELRVLNGTGLVISPSTVSTDIFNSTRSVPLISVKIADLLPSGVYWQQLAGLRVTAIFGVTGLDSNFDHVAFALENFQAVGGMQRAEILKLYDTTTKFIVRRTVAGLSSAYPSHLDNLTHDVVRLHMDTIGHFEMFTAASASDNFPSEANYQSRSHLDLASYSDRVWTSLIKTNDALAFAFHAGDTNSSGTPRGWIKKFRVEYLQPGGGVSPTQTGSVINSTPVTLTRASRQTAVVRRSPAAATTVYLPGTPTIWDEVTVKDGTGDAATNNITVNGNGKNIDGAATYVISTDRKGVTFVYDGTEWGSV